MRRTVLRLGAVASVTVATVVGVAPLLARADAPQQQGWWTSANPGGLPANPASAAADVPADGLLVQAGPVNPTAACGCTALAGLVYELADGTTATDLTLKVAPQSATTPVASLELCTLVNPTLDAEQGGPMGDAPDYDCKQHESASLGAGGSSFTFHVGSLVSDGILAVAVVPGDSTSRVVLSKPDSSSLATTVAAPSSHFSAPAPVPSSTTTAPASTGGGAPAAPAPAPQLPSQGSVGGTDSGQSPVVAPVPSSPAASPLAAAPVAAESSPAGGTKPVAVLILIAGLGLGAALWTMAGRGPASDLPDT